MTYQGMSMAQITDEPPVQVTVLSRAVLGFALVAFAWGLVRLAADVRLAVSFPYAFDYGEGVVWQQMRDMMTGQAYAPIHIYPAVAYEYPPIFHFFTAAVTATLRLDPLYAGRLVSVASTAVCAVLIGRLTYCAVNCETRVTTWGAALFASLIFATLPVVGAWALLMRVDLLACAFTLAGMLLASRAPRSVAAAVAAGLMFTLAIYTRQTCLPAPVAAFLVLFTVYPGRAWVMAGVGMGSGLAALAAAEITAGGGFLLNIITYNVNRIIWEHAYALGMVLLANVAVISIAIMGAAIALRVLGISRWTDLPLRRAGNSRDTPAHRVVLAIVVLTLALKTATLPAILKSGASDNYLIDWFSELAILVGIAVVPLWRAAQRLPARPGVLLFALVGVGLPLQAVEAAAFPDFAAAKAKTRALDAIVAYIRRSPRPIISDDATLLLRAGQPLRWEPAIVAELGSAGRYDEASFVAMIRDHRFGFFVTDGDRGDLLFDQRFNPAVAAEINRSYPRRLHVAGRTLHFPVVELPDLTAE